MNPIILFLHFHKCAGTSVNSAFNNFKKYPLNKNGNPYKTKDEILQFWNYNSLDFENFKKALIENNIEFIALEWNFFKNYNAINFSNIELITVMRDPYERYVSNMLHELKFDKCYDMQIFEKKKIKHPNKFFLNYNKFNYYTKILSGLGNDLDTKITTQHFNDAKKNLEKLSTIIILEIPETFDLLKKYNIYNIKQQNKSNTEDKNKLIMNKNFFIEQNKFDYLLYNHAVKLSKIQLSNMQNI